MVEAFLLSLAPTRNGMYRTGLFTPSAADTLWTVRVFHRVDFHLTGFCTFSTSDTFIHIHTVSVNGYLIKYGIKSSKGTNIFTERSVNNNGQNNRYDQNRIFPYVQPANGTAHRFIQKHQRKSALQRSGRTDQFTEIRSSLSHYICKE